MSFFWRNPSIMVSWFQRFGIFPQFCVSSSRWHFETPAGFLSKRNTLAVHYFDQEDFILLRIVIDGKLMPISPRLSIFCENLGELDILGSNPWAFLVCPKTSSEFWCEIRPSDISSLTLQMMKNGPKTKLFSRILSSNFEHSAFKVFLVVRLAGILNRSPRAYLQRCKSHTCHGGSATLPVEERIFYREFAITLPDSVRYGFHAAIKRRENSGDCVLISCHSQWNAFKRSLPILILQRSSENDASVYMKNSGVWRNAMRQSIGDNLEMLVDRKTVQKSCTQPHSSESRAISKNWRSSTWNSSLSGWWSPYCAGYSHKYWETGRSVRNRCRSSRRNRRTPCSPPVASKILPLQWGHLRDRWDWAHQNTHRLPSQTENPDSEDCCQNRPLCRLHHSRVQLWNSICLCSCLRDHTSIYSSLLIRRMEVLSHEDL